MTGQAGSGRVEFDVDRLAVLAGLAEMADRPAAVVRSRMDG